MPVSMRLPTLAAGAATVVLLAGLSAGAQSYFHAPAGGPPAYTTWGSPRTSLRSSPYSSPYAGGYASPWGTPSAGMPLSMYGAAGPTYGSYGTVPWSGATYSRPRGRMTYDVYTPYGRMEHTYRFRRNGTVDLDIDD